MFNSPFAKIVFVSLFLALLFACAEEPPEGADPELVSEITSVQLDIVEGNPRQLHITVQATVPTSGWTEPHLNQYLYFAPPADGIFDFDYMARPPRESSLQVVTQIELVHVLDSYAGNLVGVRIHAEQNNMEAILAENAAPTAFFEFRGSDETDRFVVRLVQEDKIQHARDLLSGVTLEQPSVMGTIIKQPVDYNPAWIYHLESESIRFFDIAVEVCDGNMQYLQDNLDDVGGALLPNSQWCPWGSQLTREIRM